MSGTEIAHAYAFAMGCPVLAQHMPTRFLCDVSYRDSVGHRMCYAVSGTETRARYAVPGTEIAYGAGGAERGGQG
eukprot:3940759-Rhodomonas_salina.3